MKDVLKNVSLLERSEPGKLIFENMLGVETEEEEIHIKNVTSHMTPALVGTKILFHFSFEIILLGSHSEEEVQEEFCVPNEMSGHV